MSAITTAGIAGSTSVFSMIRPGNNILINKESILNSAPEISIIGEYGQWATDQNSKSLPSHSFRNPKWKNHKEWQASAKKVTLDRMGLRSTGVTPQVMKKKEYEYDGLHVEDLSWQLPYGRATEAILLKPAGAKGRLPGILAFHDHGGNKYFGIRKITKTNVSIL